MLFFVDHEMLDDAEIFIIQNVDNILNNGNVVAENVEEVVEVNQESLGESSDSSANNEGSPADHTDMGVEDSEEEPLPGPSGKRKRKSNQCQARHANSSSEDSETDPLLGPSKRRRPEDDTSPEEHGSSSSEEFGEYFLLEPSRTISEDNEDPLDHVDSNGEDSDNNLYQDPMKKHTRLLDEED